MNRSYCDRCGADITYDPSYAGNLPGLGDGLCRKVTIQIGTSYVHWDLCPTCHVCISEKLDADGLQVKDGRPVSAAPKPRTQTR